jgi:hypothetical protein
VNRGINSELIDTVTDFINALTGNSSVNTAQHATIDEAVFLCRPRRAAVDQPVSKQRLGKHTTGQAVTSAIIETVFSVGSVRSACKRSECSDRVSSGAVTSQS